MAAHQLPAHCGWPGSGAVSNGRCWFAIEDGAASLCFVQRRSDAFHEIVDLALLDDKWRTKCECVEDRAANHAPTFENFGRREPEASDRLRAGFLLLVGDQIDGGNQA